MTAQTTNWWRKFCKEELKKENRRSNLVKMNILNSNILIVTG